MAVYGLVLQLVKVREEGVVSLELAQLPRIGEALAHNYDDVRVFAVAGRGVVCVLIRVLHQVQDDAVQRILAVALRLLYVKGAGRGEEVHDGAGAELVVVPVHVYAVAVHQSAVEAAVDENRCPCQGQCAPQNLRRDPHLGSAGEQPPGENRQRRGVYEAEYEHRLEFKLVAAGDVKRGADAAQVYQQERPAAKLRQRIVGDAEDGDDQRCAYDGEARPAYGVQHGENKRYPGRAQLVERTVGRALPRELAQRKQLSRYVKADAAEQRLTQPVERRAEALCQTVQAIEYRHRGGGDGRVGKRRLTRGREGAECCGAEHPGRGGYKRGVQLLHGLCASRKQRPNTLPDLVLIRQILPACKA